MTLRTNSYSQLSKLFGKLGRVDNRVLVKTYLQHQNLTWNCWNGCRREKHQTKPKSNKPDQTDSLRTLDHLISLSKGYLQNFSFLGSVKVGSLWLVTKQNKTKKIGFRGYLSHQLKLSWGKVGQYLGWIFR